MLEIETKIKIDNLELLKKKLKQLSAKNSAILDQIDTYYNYPVESRDFSKTDEALRLRKTTESDPKTLKKLKEVVDLTYKGPNLDKKVSKRKLPSKFKKVILGGFDVDKSKVIKTYEGLFVLTQNFHYPNQYLTGILGFDNLEDYSLTTDRKKYYKLHDLEKLLVPEN